MEDGVKGCLSSGLDADGLAEKIHNLVSDPVRLHAAGLAARQKAEECFSINTMVRQYTSLYGELASGP